MRVHICAVGRLRAGPEKDLIDNYLNRFDRTGRALGLGPARVIEVEDKKNGGMPAEAALLRRAIPAGSLICVMDERGKVETSPDFANRLGGWRDQGRGDVAFVIGANDVTNPAAHEPGSPIAGMPILDVENARTVMVLKRSMNPGFAGVDNELYGRDNTMMIFGDAKDTVTRIVSGLKDL